MTSIIGLRSRIADGLPTGLRDPRRRLPWSFGGALTRDRSDRTCVVRGISGGERSIAACNLNPTIDN